MSLYLENFVIIELKEGIGMGETIGLYIHIPFCQKHCHYCDFLKFVDHDDKIDQYVDYLVKEMALYQEKDYQLDTIYFGGGTPSYIESHLMTKIMDGIRRYFTILDDCEISIEMNPESVNREKIQTYLDNGFNRFTMGVQSFNDEVLRMMGRLHDRQTVLDKVKLCRQMGIKNLGIDLMFANPKQTMDILLDDIDQAMKLDVNHISYYSLMIKEGTPFERWVQTKQIQLFDDEDEREMYHTIQKTLKAHGFEQYEISNFCKHQSMSRHNSKYWTLQNYIGLGMGASSNIDLVRFTNTRRFDKYFEMIDQGEFPVQYSEKMTFEDREKEYIMLNLRLLKGFNIKEINQKFNIDFMKKYQKAIEKHLAAGVIEITDDRLVFTDFGLDVGNQFYLDIL